MEKHKVCHGGWCPYLRLYAAVFSEDFCEKYQGFYDKDTREWIEERCADPDCEFCLKRPKKHGTQCGCAGIYGRRKRGRQKRI